MDKESPFNILVDLLKTSKLSDEDGYLRAELSQNRNVTDVEIYSALEKCGHKKTTNCIIDNVLYVNRSSHTWKDGYCPIFMDTVQFWKQIQSAENLPNMYFIVKEAISSVDNEAASVIWAYNSFFIWKRLLTRIADHFQSNKAIVFITSENSVTKLDIPLIVNNSDLQQLEQPKRCHDEILKLYSLIEINDPHSKERVAVLRTALSEVTSSADGTEKLLFELIQRSPLLLRKYDELYDIYTRRFSVNKLLNELDEKSLEFTSKINEYISSSQNKALTIPGALIAIGALVKSGGILESAIIFLGLWIIMSVTKTANDIYRESFDSLDSRLNTAFKKYLKFDEGKEVRDNATQIEAELRSQIKNAKARLRNIDKWALFMLVGGAIFLIISIYNNINISVPFDFQEQLKHYVGFIYQLASIKYAGL
ncbi:hypothetical protein [Kosakonia sp.]|uniref:hypothetical protein n=1 Tax=Kosakonia sp. TaxID=1916651 RepID=UPI0028A72522|nr:hypothetical protein [Kosakonia sp.]